MKAPFPYAITATLHEGQNNTLFRAVRNVDGRPVLLKALDPRRSRPRDIERLRHEYALCKDLDLQSIVKPLALETHEGMPALVMEEFAGESLDHLLGAPMALENFLELAARIAAAVAELHEREIVHRDLKPQNILVDAETGQVKLTDFGLASRLPREHTTTESPRLIEGSLPYLSPEQTGRMNRAIDSRADLYALGVVFYELLTGRLPFEATDPLEWVHYHVARAPQPLSSFVPGLPEVLSALVLRLLAKMAEDRYQTARGLQFDLERCLGELRDKGRIDRFPLGAHDVSDRFQIPEKLYGREDEVAALLAAFDRVVAAGAPELVLVCGYSGIGKSVLVHELHKPVVRRRGFFISGKFDQYVREIPYSTIVQAFGELVLEILAESEERIAGWRQRLGDALGNNGQLIVDVIPQIELVIGPQPAVPELPPTEALNRFRSVFRQFIGVFARKEHPLALVLDDLQWADSATLGLLEELMTYPETRVLLVVGAYRDNEVNPAHPLMLALDRVRKEHARVSDIVLGPLSREHLAALLGDTLRRGREDVAPLARLVHEKTAGNPFFVSQFLTELHEERLIEFDGRAGVWRWDVAQIRAKGFTDNVVELMLGKLVRLPETTREALKQLACLGNSAEVALLLTACGRSESQMHADLWEAVRAGLVLRLNDSYKFIHDRVQEAAYSLIPEEQRAEMHLRIGRLLLSQLPEEAIAEWVFDVVNQLNHGVALITDPHEKETLCRLDFQAGRKAKASIAHAAARSYLAQAAALLPQDAWYTRYEETLALTLELSECEYLVGDFQRADALFDLILQRARSNPDQARVHRLRMRLYQLTGRFDDAVAVALIGLRLFGVSFPATEAESQAAFEAEHRVLAEALRGRRVADLADAPIAVDVDARVILGLLSEALSPSYLARPQLFPLLVIKALHYSLQYGNTEESCFAYSAYGAVLVSNLGDIDGAYEFSLLALRLNEKFNDPKMKGKLLLVHGGNVNFWRRSFATSLPFLERGILASLEIGDLLFAFYNAYLAIWLRVEKGDPLDEVIEVLRRYAALSERSHFEVGVRCFLLLEQFVADLRGAAARDGPDPRQAHTEAQCLAFLQRAGFGWGIAHHHIMQQVLACFEERHADARAAAVQAAAILGELRANPAEATHHFYHALALTALYPQAGAEEQRRLAQTLAGQLQTLKRWAANCPENYANRHALVSAEVARIEGRYLEAEGLYEDAIHSARDNGFMQQEALAYELASRFYRARGFVQFADTYLRDARSCYERWGADGKVRRIDQQHPELREARFFAPTATFAVGPEQLDLLSVTKASQTISSELVLDELIRTLLRVSLEQGGAQRGALILSRGGALSIEAEAVLDHDGVATTILPSAPVSSSKGVPTSLVHYVQRTRQRVILGDAAADAGKFAGDDYFAVHRPRSVLCLPILRQAELIGLLYLENDLLAGAFTAERLTALALLATQAAISMENALLLTEERAARAAAEEAERRSAILAEAGRILSDSLDNTETLARLGQLCVRSLSDWCVIDIVEGEAIRRVAGAHKDPASAPLLAELRRRYPPRRDSPYPVARVLRTGQPLLFAEISDEDVRASCLDETHAQLIRALGTTTALAVPLVARGQTLGVLTLASGATGRRFTEADLELVQEVARRAAIAIDNAQLYHEAQQAVRVRDEFLTVASHELNTPLTSLSLSLEAIVRAVQSGPPLNPQTMGKLAERALRQAARLTRLNGELLDVSRIHTHRFPLDLGDVDLGVLVHEVIGRFKLDLRQAGCSVTVREGGPVVGRWDRSRIDQVVTNLLANALKFGAGKPIEVSLGEEAGTARLAIQDHGIGIDPAWQGRIFERFERAVSPTHYGGLGLGLYISRRIVEAHGGTIRVESELGGGALFTLELPCAGPPLACRPSDLQE
ncbi:ATP-binding sensor histidine kinase [Nannocystis radixulma]|uniref:histidine kinase n=1 Tax=Nannocystis radixulma TaxID=2995305 RepID=A0ABT5BDW8_9BACT|nr:ATP-binding sensor histidine kinase [Nannocystis radixulma]MDC0672326.1 trifunctional serine/threonine-protein kinase/ATP-binding protein/sensor histidine kinase [Nannocystis radixulma]